MVFEGAILKCSTWSFVCTPRFGVVLPQQLFSGNATKSYLAVFGKNEPEDTGFGAGLANRRPAERWWHELRILLSHCDHDLNVVFWKTGPEIPTRFSQGGYEASISIRCNFGVFKKSPLCEVHPLRRRLWREYWERLFYAFWRIGSRFTWNRQPSWVCYLHAFTAFGDLFGSFPTGAPRRNIPYLILNDTETVSCTSGQAAKAEISVR